MRYTTSGQFRGAVEEELNVIFSDMSWRMLNDYLFTCALHPPYDDSDVADAIRQFRKLKKGLEPL